MAEKGKTSAIAWILGAGGLVIAIRVGLKIARAVSKAGEDAEAAEAEERAALYASLQEPEERGGRKETFVATSEDPAHPLKGRPWVEAGGGYGPFTVHVTIRADGSVEDARAEGDTPPSVVYASRGLQFEGGAGEADVRWKMGSSY
ncbi:MAG: hypothetical protein ACOZNI_14410 [Myxococcota bacterium]